MILDSNSLTKQVQLKCQSHKNMFSTWRSAQNENSSKFRPKIFFRSGQSVNNSAIWFSFSQAVLQRPKPMAWTRHTGRKYRTPKFLLKPKQNNVANASICTLQWFPLSTTRQTLWQKQNHSGAYPYTHLLFRTGFTFRIVQHYGPEFPNRINPTEYT